MFTFLIPVLDLIADPDTINRLLILLFDPESMNISAQSEVNIALFLSLNRFDY